MRRSKLGYAESKEKYYKVFLNIGSIESMKVVRQKLGAWLPDCPTWKTESFYAPKSYFRNNFKFDGEYILNLPLESKNSLQELFRISL